MGGVIVVTGAGGALGTAVVDRLVKDGEQVFGMGRIARSLPGDASFTAADLSDSRSAKAAFTSIAETRPIAGLVNVAEDSRSR